jgi:hypothetical protein
VTKIKTNACAQDKAFFNSFFFYNFCGLLEQGIIKVDKFSVFPFASSFVKDTSHRRINYACLQTRPGWNPKPWSFGNR